MSVGCNYLREHVIPEARIHYAYIDAGGSAPNVVQDHATVRYEVRTPYVRDLRDLFDRVVDVARGAALMTGTTLEVELAMAFTEYVPNKALGAIASEAMQEVGAPQWDEADFQLARQFLESYDPETRSAVEAEIRHTYGDRAEAVLQRPLATDVIPFDPAHIRLQAGSTDVGDVGYAAPTLNLLGGHRLCGQCGALLADDRPGLQPAGTQGAAHRRPGHGALRCAHHALPRGHCRCQGRGVGPQRRQVHLPAARFGQAASGYLLMQTGGGSSFLSLPARFAGTHRNSAVRFYFPPEKKRAGPALFFLTVMQSAAVPGRIVQWHPGRCQRQSAASFSCSGSLLILKDDLVLLRVKVLVDKALDHPLGIFLGIVPAGRFPPPCSGPPPSSPVLRH